PDDNNKLYFNAAQDFTVEMWIKYNGQATGNESIIAMLKGSETRFDICTRGGVNPAYRGQLYLQLLGSPGNRIWTVTTATDLNDDQWHHIAVVRDADGAPLRVYVDGVDATGNVVSEGSIDELSGAAEVFLGGFGASIVRTWFGGQIDEVRIWNVARSASQIGAMMRRQLKGDEEGLLAYWPLDEGTGAAITDLTEGAHYGTLVDGVYWTDNTAPLNIAATTDVEGNYVLDGIRYGERTTFEVRPFEGVRQFSPVFKTITLSTGHPVENQVNFVETTSLTVSGAVQFAGRDCFMPNVEIHLDGQLRGGTDTKGKFAVSTDIGNHWIKPVAVGHTFDPDSVQLYVDDDTSGVIFTNTTTRTLSGRVGGGGCLYPIGDVFITIRSENNCIEVLDTVQTGYITTYRLDLPPQKYLVSAEVDMDSAPPGIEGTDVQKFLERLGTREVDLTSDSAVLDFIYRTQPEVRIVLPERYDVSAQCPQLSVNGRSLPASLPVIPQADSLTVIIEVNEYYGDNEDGDSNLCALDSGALLVYDELFDREDEPRELEVINGKATYWTFACTPSLIAGRVDADGNDRSFQKALRVMTVVEGAESATATKWVLVTGHVEQEGSDFVTATTELPLYILRDPPGDNSYAFLENETTLRTRIDYGKFFTTEGGAIKIKAWAGVKAGWWAGFGAGVEGKVEFKKQFETEFFFGGMTYSERSTDVTVTTKTTLSTSADDAFIGDRADVFVGVGLNCTFAEIGVVEVDYDSCLVKRYTGVGFQADSFTTIFAYTEQYIEDVLIPELESKEEYFVADSMDAYLAGLYRTAADVWRERLYFNDSLKQEAALVENRSFSSGANYTYNHTTDTTTSYEWNTTFVFESKVDVLGFGYEGSVAGFEIRLPMQFRLEKVVDWESRTGSTSHAVGYTLSDDDLGDHFTVDIKTDPVYGSPIFDVLAGASSCPYEPWYDLDSGAARMMSRDMADLGIAPPRLDLVPPDQPAAFKLTLGNLSPTEEAREYILRELTTANPGGAIIRANGSPIGNGLSYFISGDPIAGNSNDATLTVERGPTKYGYDSLAVMLYPPCEYDVWGKGGPLQRADTVYFSVTFEAPCSDVRLFRPLSGWEYNKDMHDTGDSLIIRLTDYELEISEEARVDEIGVEYRHLGTGEEEGLEWKVIDFIDTLINPTATRFAWYPGDYLDDGVYELRAYTQCASGRGLSAISEGTIDRHAPQVFGTPEPSDGELSFGEDISITFSERIDYQAIHPDSITLRYLDGPHAGALIPIETVCDGKTIIITPTAAVDPNDLEDRQLEARVAGVRDLVRNPMESAQAWSFDVRQSVFTWCKTDLVADVAFRAPGKISAKLVNGGDAAADFDIDSLSLPAWITEATPDSGSLPPGGTEVVSFTIQEDIALGSYDAFDVLATSDRGDSRLDIHLTVSCHEPLWSFDPRRYEHTMTIVTEVDIGGAISSDPEDRVAAFVGGQLRGVAHIGPGPESDVAYLTVYSNRSSGETVRFQVWDADSCRLYNNTDTHFAFTANGMIGTPGEPVSLTAQDHLVDTAQVIPVREGWNWFSLNTQAVDMSVDGVLSFLTPATGDLIKSQTAFAEFDPLLGWVGTLQLLDNTSSYMVRLSEEGEIYVEGSDVDLLTTPIPIYEGWNWIGYIPTCPTDVTPALAGLGSTPMDGDVIRSQTAFAQYVDKDGWYGNLDLMEPGEGYKLYLQKVGGAISGFTYPGCAGAAATLIARVPDEDVRPKTDLDAGIPGWSLDCNAYQYSMTVTAALTMDGDEWRDENGMIGAFVNGECRGLAQLIHLSGINRYVAFLMVHSNEIAGEKVIFKAYDPGERAVYNVGESVTYEADATIGTVREPLLLTTEGIDFELADIVPGTYSLSQNYPNPFNPSTIITFSLKEAVHTRIEVFNVLGQSVKILADQLYAAGRHQLSWNGTDAQGQPVASGVYFYRIVAGDIIDTKKMVLLK
ncbi:MAG TPA: LamG-like jellyroll fold domain-containing protein, partial [Acidobacteriota bacterium]|nr:LamG-like jellyroll fold domain-containing protein [Acidobacteriota bacterium]